MATTKKDPVLVVLQLSGGNDYLNTVVPYNDPLYWDNRPVVKIPEDEVLPIDGGVGLHPNMGAVRDMYNGRRRGHRPRRGISQLPQVPLPVHGHLAHLRARQAGHRGLAGQGPPGTWTPTRRTW